ncbi:MAG: HAD family hydrolase [Clostridium sp.]
MSKLYFITDLDRTIIHSKNKGFKCVEKIGDREITYMTENSYKDFMELLEMKNFQFIPCTMRNISQTLRVDFIKKYDPKLIICSNGAQIYVNGKLDQEWHEKMRKIIDIKDIEKDIEYIKTLDLCYDEIRNIEEFYITIKYENVELAEESYQILKDKFEDFKKVIQIGVKIFIINEKINKIYASDYIINKFNMKNIITAGDSEVDEEFTKRGISILPKHASFSHKESIITTKCGIHSTEDMIDKLNLYINKQNNCEIVLM